MISPEHDDPREIAVLGALFATGLERYHVRKPHWNAEQLAVWLRALPRAWYPRLVLHQHHELVAEFGLGGRHWRDESRGYPKTLARRTIVGARSCRALNQGRSKPAPLRPSFGFRTAPNDGGFTSRSCHDLATLRAALGRYDSVFFGPMFSSISKPGHGPRPELSLAELSALLARRTSAEQRTAVLALGGVTAQNLSRCRDLGFDGAAVLGAVWQAPDPVDAFHKLQAALGAALERCISTQSALSQDPRTRSDEPATRTATPSPVG
ncbi:MAG: thiamine phosphate synthase [Opitutaceae bacterium]